MLIKLNGADFEAPDGSSVSDLLRIKGVEPAHAVVEYNMVILKIEELDTIRLKMGDVVEVLRFVGGG